MYPENIQEQTPQQQEQMLGKYMLSRSAEKTWLDKVLAKEDVERMRCLMLKEDWSRKDLSEILFLMAAIESKLVNYGEYDRYLNGKFYAWIREFGVLIELQFDYQEQIDKGKIRITKQTATMLKNVLHRNLHNLKFLVDNYLLLCRSTLSLSAFMVGNMMKEHFEYTYGEPTSIKTQDKGFLGIFRGGNK